MVPLPVFHCADLWLRHVPREVRPIAATYAGAIGDLTRSPTPWIPWLPLKWSLDWVQMFRAVRLLKQLCDLLSTRIV